MIDLKSAAAYINNSRGGAAVNTFMRDADPIGKSLLDELKNLTMFGSPVIESH